MMMSTKAKVTGLSPVNGSSVSGGGSGGTESGAEWEMRPGGMLVQKRNPGSDRVSTPAPTIRVRVKHGSVYHEISISSQATFGELKKMLSGPTGLHHQDQKLTFKDKERDSNAFLDIVGVKDRSKMVLIEDALSKERRYLEMRRSAKMEKASKSISEISLEVDKLSGKVSALESIVSKGKKVAEGDVLTLIELFMNQLLKLDQIIADGDVKLQRKMQVRRVQKYVETLDMLKIKNSMPSTNGNQAPLQPQLRQPSAPRASTPQQQNQSHSNGYARNTQQQLQQQHRHSTSGTIVTTKWETFDSTPLSMPGFTTSAPISVANGSVNSNSHWDLI